MKQMSAERKAHIKASLAWQQFTRDADEVSNIMLCMYNAYACTYMHMRTYA